MILVPFLLYSVFCYWAIFMDGAETLEGWKSFFLFDWFAASLTAQELKFHIGISWLASLVGTLIILFSGASAT